MIADNEVAPGSVDHSQYSVPLLSYTKVNPVPESLDECSANASPIFPIDQGVV